jgi:hypothetical protein
MFVVNEEVVFVTLIVVDGKASITRQVPLDNMMEDTVERECLHSDFEFSSHDDDEHGASIENVDTNIEQPIDIVDEVEAHDTEISLKDEYVKNIQLVLAK